MQKDMEEIRVGASHQLKHYYELCSAQGELLEEVQTLRTQVTILSSGGRVESAGG